MNQHKQCSVPDCHALRTKLGRYCRRHRRRLAQYGHPTARPLSRTGEDLSGWSRKIEALLAANSDHAGLSRATKELQQQLDEAAERVGEGRALSGAALHWARLANHQVTPLAILARVVAVIVIDRDNPRVFPDDRSREYAVARAVFGLAPQGGAPPGARVLASTGRRMIDQYLDLIVAAVAALKVSEDDARRRAAAMQAPLRIPSNNP